VDSKPTPGDLPLHDLPDPLRQAVEHVRSAPVPADALDRSLAKAEKISGLNSAAPRKWSFQRHLALAGIAASFLILSSLSLYVMTGRNDIKTDPVATQVASAAKDGTPSRSGPVRFKGSFLHRDDERGAESAPAAATAPPAAGRRLDIGPDPDSKTERISVDRLRRGADADTGGPRPVFQAGAAGPIGLGGAAPSPQAAPAEAAQQRLRGMEESMRRVPGSVSKDDYEAAKVAARRSGGDAKNLLSELDTKRKAIEELRGTQLRVRDDGKGKNAIQEEDLDLAKGGSNKDKEAASKSRVWRRNSGRPTFARVYVGDGNSLDLVSLDVQVTIQGPRARTVVDHVFRNPNGRQLEGTFEYPLPSGASPSYFAMFLGQSRQVIPPRFARRGEDKVPPVLQDAFVALSPELLVRDVNTTDWGRLQEARIVGKDKALETYEDVVRGRIDPALLEYASGNTFRGRVFPIPPSGYNRVIIAYEELLPVSQGKMLYRFPLPDCKLSSLHLSLQASASECRAREFQPAGSTTQEAAGRVYYTRNWTDEAPQDPEVLFACTPAVPEVQAVSGRRGENGPQYVYARVRPNLKPIATEKTGADRAVFLLDTSLSEQGDRFGVSIKLLRAILEGDSAIKEFNVVAFNAAACWVEPKGWLPNTAEGRERLFAKLDGIVLEGATDVGAALDRLCEPPGGVPDKSAVDCFLLSDGHVTWGETEVATLVARFEARCSFAPRFHCYLTGLGAENSELFEALTRRGGGVFSCRSEADLPAAAAAHRNQCLRVDSVRFVDGPAASDVLVAGRRAAVYPGGELVVAARFPATGRTTLLVEGNFAGERFAQKFPIDIRDGGELAPRGWAEVAVASLLALNDPQLDPLVTAYCQQFNIGSRVASFLVLENEADYKRFNLEDERGRTVAGDLGAYLNRMWETLAQAISPRLAFLRFLERLENRTNLLVGDGRDSVHKLVSLMGEKDFELPASALAGALVHTADVPPEYLARRSANVLDAAPYLAEAKRRSAEGDVDGAVRVLSSIIEEHPSRGDALRLVGYRLLDLKQPSQAAQLFERVQQQRPFEPHSYRDLARALEETDNLALAAVQYEIVLGSAWHNRFRDSLKLVALEEYTSLMRDALRRGTISPGVAGYFRERLARLSSTDQNVDLRVTISWNTDATDVDLWVIEPDGTKCFYQHNRTKSGGELSQDQTQGYGPERYQVVKALKGRYRILVHYFGTNPNLLAGETHVNVVVTRFAGTLHEETQRHTVVLRKQGEEAEVCEVEF
jgi:tetratricopeptide (TPR) repeat protein